ncbi:MAG: ankyrin repeat domain-containing protein [Acidiferrobacterales bacterium]|nr:ankyrin repeat domain-containing protein [Acidiferrobacterales bacterium]
MALFAQPAPKRARNIDVADSGAKQLRIAAALREFPLVRLLVEKEGVHPDSTCEGKPTALCYAVLQKDRCMTQYLLSHGADPNQQDQLGMTSIHYATMGGCCYCLASVIHCGAKIDQACVTGKTAYSLCAKRKDLSECRELLKRYGAGDFPGVSRNCFH